MKTICFGITMFFCTLLCQAWGAEASSTGGTSRLIELLKPLSTMSGDFSQIQRDSEGQLLLESSGIFSVARPGKLRWETQQPFSQLLISNGEKLWLYDEDLEQVTVSTVNGQLNQTPAVIFSGDVTVIDNQFMISFTDSDHFTLRPRAEEGYFQRLDLAFEQGQLTDMTILDGFGQQTQFVFSNTVLNAELPYEQFNFVPPEGTDVLIHD